MKKFFILSIFLFQINDLISQEFKISVTAESRNDYKIIGSDSNGDINNSDPDLIFNLGSELIFEVRTRPNCKSPKREKCNETLAMAIKIKSWP